MPAGALDSLSVSNVSERESQQDPASFDSANKLRAHVTTLSGGAHYRQVSVHLFLGSSDASMRLRPGWSGHLTPLAIGRRRLAAPKTVEI